MPQVPKWWQWAAGTRPPQASKAVGPRQGATQRVTVRDLLGMPCRESGYLFSGLWRGKGKGEGENGEEQRESQREMRKRNRRESRNGEKGERQKLPLQERAEKEGTQVSEQVELVS